MDHKKTDDSIRKLLLVWGSCKHELEHCFKTRETRQASQLMIRSIQCFLDYIYETNGCSEIEKERQSIKDLAVKPVNVAERLDFIVSRPGLYHSYIQLSELFSEQEKQYAKHLALSKVKKTRPD